LAVEGGKELAELLKQLKENDGREDKIVNMLNKSGGDGCTVAFHLACHNPAAMAEILESLLDLEKLKILGQRAPHDSSTVALALAEKGGASALIKSLKTVLDSGVASNNGLITNLLGTGNDGNFSAAHMLALKEPKEFIGLLDKLREKGVDVNTLLNGTRVSKEYMETWLKGSGEESNFPDLIKREDEFSVAGILRLRHKTGDTEIRRLSEPLSAATQ
jgi:hypothetical protein